MGKHIDLRERPIDSVPTNGSTNLIDSNAVFDGLAGKEDLSNKQTDLTASATKYPTVDAVNTGLNLKISKHVGATYTTNAIQTVTAAEYAAIGTPDASTLYFIV